MLEKLKSRKFQVFLVWTILAVASVFVPSMPKATVIEYYGLVSILYIGGNVAQDYIASRKKPEPQKA